jgi:hypothetical protein
MHSRVLLRYWGDDRKAETGNVCKKLKKVGRTFVGISWTLLFKIALLTVRIS